MNGRTICKIALAFVAGAAMAVGGPTLAGGRGGGGAMHGGGMQGGGMPGGGMPGGGFRGHDGFHHDGFHHGHGHVVFFAVGAGWPGWWGYPYDGWPYYPAYSNYDEPPTQYIEKEKGTGSAGASTNGWRYRCDQPSGYYPHVKHCPWGWQMEPGQPPP